MNSHVENFIIDQQLSYSLTTIDRIQPTEFLGSCSSILPTKRYHIVILDINIITLSAPSMDAMVVKPAYLP